MAKINETKEHKAQRMQDLKDLKKKMKEDKQQYNLCKKEQWGDYGYSSWCFVQHYSEYKAQNEFKIQKIKEGATLQEVENEYFYNDMKNKDNIKENKNVEKEENTELQNENKQIAQNILNNINNNTNESNNKKQFENERVL